MTSQVYGGRPKDSKNNLKFLKFVVKVTAINSFKDYIEFPKFISIGFYKYFVNLISEEFSIDCCIHFIRVTTFLCNNFLLQVYEPWKY